MDNDHSDFVTVMHGIVGWFAVKMWWNPKEGGFYEPFDTGFGRYPEPKRAIDEAKLWAAEEGIKFIDPRGE